MSRGGLARITDVRTSTTVVALPQPLQLGAMTVTRREYVGVQVRAVLPDGTEVTGVSYALTREAPMAEIVERLVAPHVVGRDLPVDDPAAGVRAAWDAALRLLEPRPRPRPRFGHGAEYDAGRWTMRGCFHPSQQNTFTGVLTPDMLDAVLERAKAIAATG